MRPDFERAAFRRSEAFALRDQTRELAQGKRPGDVTRRFEQMTKTHAKQAAKAADHAHKAKAWDGVSGTLIKAKAQGLSHVDIRRDQVGSLKGVTAAASKAISQFTRQATRQAQKSGQLEAG